MIIDKNSTVKLLIYSILSGICFSYLVLVAPFGLGIFVFAVIQLISIVLLTNKESVFKNRKALLWFIPILILTFKSVISDMQVFDLPNMLLIFIIYSVMSLQLSGLIDFKENSCGFLGEIFANVFTPLSHFNVPVKCIAGLKKENTNKQLLKRILIGIVISIPCLILLMVMLSSADLIFSKKTSGIFTDMFHGFSGDDIFRIIIGVLAFFYLFGLFYSSYYKEYLKVNRITSTEKSNTDIPLNNIVLTKIEKVQTDFIIVNILLVSILIVYTFFTFIQFKYLFLNKEFTYDFTYSEYARKGFFQLLFLSIINVLVIYSITYVANLKDKLKYKNGFILCKCSLFYLCFVTVILLISSFYRMTLYNQAYGLTRLRVFVIIFLAFEAIGLLITFVYIQKPKFNIMAIYTFICLIFYLSINILPIDYYIAKNNIDKYYDGAELDYNYTISLSSDASKQIERLIDDRDVKISTKAKSYFEYHAEDYDLSDWQSFNISRKKAYDIYNKIR